MWSRLQETLGEVPSHVRDDRGVVHAVRDGGYSGAPVPLREEEVPRRDRARWREIRKLRRLERQAASPLYHIVFGVHLLFLAAAGIFAGSLALRTSNYLGAAAMLAFGAVCLAAAMRNPTWMRRRCAYLRHQLDGAGDACLVCGYDIGSGITEADGCTVCPECGAAWRVTSREPAADPPA